jgi:DNA-binding MarR family transcriptional regulator
MNFYETNPVRKRHSFSWREEYLLGLLEKKGEVPTKEILTLSTEAMSENTTHKYLMKLVIGGYVVQLEDNDDKRFVYVRLTEKGKDFLKELQYA